jgi:hypothetical protein
MFNPQIGIGATRVLSGSAPSLSTTMATTHYNRVIADGIFIGIGIGIKI